MHGPQRVAARHWSTARQMDTWRASATAASTLLPTTNTGKVYSGEVVEDEAAAWRAAVRDKCTDDDRRERICGRGAGGTAALTGGDDAGASSPKNAANADECTCLVMSS